MEGNQQKGNKPQQQGSKGAAPARHGAPSQGKPAFQGKPQIQRDENPNFRGIVRIAGRDLDGHFPIYKALIRVKGIGATLARTFERIIVQELKISKKTRAGDLTEVQIDRIDAILGVPAQYGVKEYLLNRQKDRGTGKNKHLLMNDLVFTTRQDMQIEKDLHTYKGWRFSIGQRVRGQHSRTTGRSGFTVGVMKKAIKEQKAAAAASAQDKGKGTEKKK